MTPERWQRVKEVFHSVAERAPGERAAILDAECTGDPDLRREVEALLAHDESDPGLLDSGSVGVRAVVAAAADKVLDDDTMGRDRLRAGDEIGPYRVVEALGAGGMGQVYKASDTRLHRTVAIKLIAAPTYGHDLLLREARAASALNHPNICTVYDVVEHHGEPLLIMELLDGRSLEAMLAENALPVERVIDLSRQIADALDAAHEAGIIHGDIKPGNVFVTARGQAKILDFGVAHVAGVRESLGRERGFEQQTVAGTPAYMSPEQARGGPMDKRTDIWSFGVMGYEMLTGRRPFQRATTAETLAAIENEEPDWNGIPVQMQELLRACLQKDPKRRMRDIGDAMRLVENAPPAPESPGKFSRWIWPIGAGLLLLVIGAMFGARYRQIPQPRHSVQFQIQPPPGTSFDAPFVSPDGTSIAVFAESSDRPLRSVLWLYSLQSNQPRQLFEPKQRGARHVIWSPNSDAVAVFADGQLKKIDLDSGSVQDLCPVSGSVGGGSWSGDTIVFSDNQQLRKVPSLGGDPVTISALDPSRKDSGHFFPEFLPDGRHFLYLRASAITDESGIYLGSLDAAPEQQGTTRVVQTRSGAVYMPSSDRKSGHVLFLRGSTLMAQAFDSRRLSTVGEPIPIHRPVTEDASVSNRYGYFSASDTGVLALIRHQPMKGALVWVDRRGTERGSVLPLIHDSPQHPRVSPDGTRLALVVAGDVWVFDLGGKPPVRLTFEGLNEVPLWAPDGHRLVFSKEAPPMGLRSVAGHASDESPRAVSPEGHFHPHGWSSDGRELIAVTNTYDPRFAWDVVKLRLDDPGKPTPVVQSRFVDGMGGASLSPDGRWLAYTSNRTGTQEVWLQAYPGPADPVRVSVSGGWNPVWARDGHELYYLEGDRMVAAAPIDVAASPVTTRPVPLFKSLYIHPHAPVAVPSWDVAPNGQFVMIKRVDKVDASPPMTVILNWAPGMGR